MGRRSLLFFKKIYSDFRDHRILQNWVSNPKKHIRLAPGNMDVPSFQIANPFRKYKFANISFAIRKRYVGCKGHLSFLTRVICVKNLSFMILYWDIIRTLDVPDSILYQESRRHCPQSLK